MDMVMAAVAAMVPKDMEAMGVVCMEEKLIGAQATKGTRQLAHGQVTQARTHIVAEHIGLDSINIHHVAFSHFPLRR